MPGNITLAEPLVAPWCLAVPHAPDLQGPWGPGEDDGFTSVYSTVLLAPVVIEHVLNPAFRPYVWPMHSSFGNAAQLRSLPRLHHRGTYSRQGSFRS